MDPNQLAWNNDFIEFLSILNKPTYVSTDNINENFSNPESNTVSPYYVQANIGNYVTLLGTAQSINSPLDMSSGIGLIDLSNDLLTNYFNDAYFPINGGGILYAAHFDASVCQLSILANETDLPASTTLSLALDIYPLNLSTTPQPVNYKIERKGFITRSSDFTQWQEKYRAQSLDQYLNHTYIGSDNPFYLINRPEGYSATYGYFDVTSTIDATSSEVLLLNLSSLFPSNTFLTQYVPQVTIDGTLVYVHFNGATNKVYLALGETLDASTLSLNLILM